MSYAIIKIKKHMAKGKPTCSSYRGEKTTCRFLYFKHFGMQPFCAFVSANVERRGEDGLGFIKPHKNCPVWKVGK